MTYSPLLRRSIRIVSAISLAFVAVNILQSPAGFAARNGLESQIRDLIKASGAESVSVAYHDLATGTELLIDGDVSFHAASTMKVPVMLEVFNEAHDGRLSLDSRITIKNSFSSLVDGSPFTLSPDDDSDKTLYARVGQSASVRELLHLMITVSSNLATNILIERVTAPRVMTLVKQLGASRIRVLRGVEDSKAFQQGLNNTTTAGDLMILLQAIAELKAVSQTASEEMLKIMLDQAFNEGIPSKLPPGVKVAHKTGSITRSYHDAAIVLPARTKPYILVVLTRGLEDEARAHRLVADISAAVYQSRDRGN